MAHRVDDLSMELQNLRCCGAADYSSSVLQPGAPPSGSEKEWTTTAEDAL